MLSMTDLTAIVQLLHMATLIGTVARRRPARRKPDRARAHRQQRTRDFGTTVAGNVLGRALYDALSNWLPWI